MPIACVYHKTESMRVVTFDEREKLLATGEWFKHPNDVNKQKEIENEKPIRREPRKRSKHSECSSQSPEAEHSAKNAFVKKVQSEQARYAGRSPMLKGEAMEFNAYMCNNGEHAQEFGKMLTKGLDTVAFPVDGEGNDS